MGGGKPTVGWGRVPRAGRVRRDEVEGAEGRARRAGRTGGKKTKDQ